MLTFAIIYSSLALEVIADEEILENREVCRRVLKVWQVEVRRVDVLPAELRGESLLDLFGALTRQILEHTKALLDSLRNLALFAAGQGVQ